MKTIKSNSQGGFLPLSLPPSVCVLAACKGSFLARICLSGSNSFHANIVWGNGEMAERDSQKIA